MYEKKVSAVLAVIVLEGSSAFAGASIGSLNVQTGAAYTLSIESAMAGSFGYTLPSGTLSLSGTQQTM